MYQQNLPNYKHDFLADPRWTKRVSEHYTFNYFSGSIAEKDINTIERRQEEAYKKIVDFLNVPEISKKIEYFIYPDKETKKALMGDDWYAQSIYNEYRIHILYTEKDKPVGEHEDTHLLSLPWGLSIGFFQEGFAEFMVGKAWDGKSHESYTKEGYKGSFYGPIKNFMDSGAWLRIDDAKAIYFYSLAGAFVSFLIQSFGKVKFEAFYKTSSRAYSAEKNSLIFEGIYGEKLEKIEGMFKSSFL